MATLYTHQERNIVKTWIFLTGFLVFCLCVAWMFAYFYENPLILSAAFLAALLLNIGSYWWSDKIILRMVHARPATREGDRELWNIVENLSITAGLPMPKLYIVDDPSPNAFATGRDKEHAAIAVHTGLLNILNRSELEGVLAHELAHVGNRDTLISTIVVVLVGFIVIASDFFLRSGYLFHNNRDHRAQGIFAVIGIVLAFFAPLIAMLIQLAISRKREFLADASGALLTRYPEGLASALEKISRAGTPSTTANHAMAHLYIANPFGRDGFITKLFMTHPPIAERVAALREMDIRQ